jgi:hypothetical protein
MRYRSRRGTAAIATDSPSGVSRTRSRSGTAPGERRVLPVVHAGRVIPRKTERVHVAFRRVRQGEPVCCGMAGVFEMQWFGGGGVDSFCAMSTA